MICDYLHVDYDNVAVVCPAFGYADGMMMGHCLNFKRFVDERPLFYRIRSLARFLRIIFTRRLFVKRRAVLRKDLQSQRNDVRTVFLVESFYSELVG